MKLLPLALALCLCFCAACAPEGTTAPAPEPASSSAGEPGFGLPTIWAEAPGIRWSLAEMPEDALVWMSPGLELEGTLARCWENLWLFAYDGPWKEGFASPEEWDYVELIRSCVFRTARLEETPALEAVCRAHGLSPALAAGGIPPEHLQQTVDTILAGEILVDPERFEKERRDTARNSIGYDPEYQLFFIQASYFPPRLLAILDWDEAAMELTMTYVEKGYDTLYTVDGLAISGGNGDSEPYPGTLEDYVTGEAPRYRVAFDGECRIRSILPLEGLEAFPDSGESSAPPASPSQSSGQPDPNNFAPADDIFQAESWDSLFAYQWVGQVLGWYNWRDARLEEDAQAMAELLELLEEISAQPPAEHQYPPDGGTPIELEFRREDEDAQRGCYAEFAVHSSCARIGGVWYPVPDGIYDQILRLARGF